MYEQNQICKPSPHPFQNGQVYYVTHTPPPTSEPSRSCANTIHKCDGMFQARGGSDTLAPEPRAILPVMPLPAPLVQEAHPGFFLSERALQLCVMVSDRKTSTPGSTYLWAHIFSKPRQASRAPTGTHHHLLISKFSPLSKCVCFSQFGR